MPTSELSRRRATFRRRLVAATTERLPYKAAALFLAMVLWLVVSAEEPTEDLVPVRLALVLDSGLTLVDPPPLVRALVVGRGRELLKLYAAEPVIRRVLPAGVPDTVRFELRPSDVDIPSGVEARVSDVQPRVVTLHFQSTVDRRVPVSSALRLSAAPGLRLAGAPRFVPESVTVTVPRNAPADVRAVLTVPERIAVADTLPITVALDTARVRGRVRPASVRVVVPVRPDAAVTIPALPVAGGDSALPRARAAP
jgi:hypothetical protein